jgi:hypothetical protein
VGDRQPQLRFWKHSLWSTSKKVWFSEKTSHREGHELGIPIIPFFKALRYTSLDRQSEHEVRVVDDALDAC